MSQRAKAALRKLVKELTPKEVAYHCGVTTQTVANWTAGTEPRARHLVKLAEMKGGPAATQLALVRELSGLED